MYVMPMPQTKASFEALEYLHKYIDTYKIHTHIHTHKKKTANRCWNEQATETIW